MKKLRLIGLLIGTLAVGMIIGGCVGARLAGRAFGMMAYSKPEIDMAANAAQTAEWLAELRLGDTNAAVNEMENGLNIQVQTFAEWDDVIWLDDKTRQDRDRWLVPVKVYRESYPASGSDLARANELLSTIPGRNPKSTCKSGVCRLDDLRLAKLKSVTAIP
ncbi:MAG TPA: hypothetical protein VH595_20095 [Verrucomicrobiae bacterium]|jgi:hypothetical protein|nr:hypothetical protein [Verrucomicrobiae bacterium]